MSNNVRTASKPNGGRPASKTPNNLLIHKDYGIRTDKRQKKSEMEELYRDILREDILNKAISTFVPNRRGLKNVRVIRDVYINGYHIPALLMSEDAVIGLFPLPNGSWKELNVMFHELMKYLPAVCVITESNVEGGKARKNLLDGRIGILAYDAKTQGMTQLMRAPGVDPEVIERLKITTEVYTMNDKGVREFLEVRWRDVGTGI